MQTLEFKKLIGNRIYLELPVLSESGIILDDATEEAVIKSEQKKYSKLKVYAVGTSVSEELVSVGDEVLVEQSALQRGILIPLTDKKKVILISPFDIIHVW